MVKRIYLKGTPSTDTIYGVTRGSEVAVEEGQQFKKLVAKPAQSAEERSKANWKFALETLLPVCIYGLIRSVRPQRLFFFNYLQSLNFTADDYSHMLAVQNVAVILFLLPFGYLINLFGYKYMILLECALHISARIIFIRSSSLYYFYLAFGLQGLGFAVDQAYYWYPSMFINQKKNERHVPYLSCLSSASVAIGSCLAAKFGQIEHDRLVNTRVLIMQSVIALAFGGCIAIVTFPKVEKEPEQSTTGSAAPKKDTKPRESCCDIIKKYASVTYETLWTNTKTSFWFNTWMFYMLVFFLVDMFISAFLTEISPNVSEFGNLDVLGQVAQLLGTLSPLVSKQIHTLIGGGSTKNENYFLNFCCIAALVVLAKCYTVKYAMILYVLVMYFSNFLMNLAFSNGCKELEEKSKPTSVGEGSSKSMEDDDEDEGVENIAQVEEKGKVGVFAPVVTMIITMIIFGLNMGMPALHATVRFRQYVFIAFGCINVMLMTRATFASSSFTSSDSIRGASIQNHGA